MTSDKDRVGGRALPPRAGSSRGQSGPAGKAGLRPLSVRSGPDRAERSIPPILEKGVLVLLFALLAVLSIRQIGSPDIGFHLEAGNYMLEGHGWPRTDPFTFTLRDHQYIDTTWGYQIIVALINRAAGPAGMTLFHAALVFGIFWIVYRTVRLSAHDRIALPILLFLGIMAAEIRFEVRPEILSWTFLAAILYLLHRHAAGLRTPLWIIPVIHLIWANIHALFVLGWAAEACFLAGLAIRDRAVDRRLLLVFAGALVVTLVNPYGWRGATFPLTLATRLQQQNVFAQTIGEFASPFSLKLSEQFPFYPKGPIFAFRAYAILSLLSLAGVWRQRRFFAILLWIAFLALSYRMIRNIPLLVVATLPAAAWGLPVEGLLKNLTGFGRLRLWPARILIGAVGIASLLTIIQVYNDTYYVSTRRFQRFGVGVSRISLPTESAAFARKAGLSGPMLNHLNFGGWLMWALPDPVFIDGRLEVVGEEFFDYYHRVLVSPEMLESCVSRYGIRWTVFPYGISPGLLARLSRDERWSLVWADRLAAVFIRKGVDPKMDALPPLEPQSVGAPPLRSLPGLGGGPRPGKARRWLDGLTSRARFPDEDYNMGLFHVARGEPGLAAERFVRTIAATNGAYYEMYNNLGATLSDMKRYDEAAACYRIVLEDAPRTPTARRGLDAIQRMRR